MYALYWIGLNGMKGNGQHILSHHLAQAWLAHLRAEHPDMIHWIQDAPTPPVVPAGSE